MAIWVVFKYLTISTHAGIARLLRIWSSISTKFIMRSSKPCLNHRGRAGMSTLPRTCKFDCLESTSYTGWITNLIYRDSALPSSAHITLLSQSPFFHFNQAPSCLIPTILQALSSSIAVATSSRTSWQLSFPSEISKTSSASSHNSHCTVVVTTTSRGFQQQLQLVAPSIERNMP